jgi:hypothetical protein
MPVKFRMMKISRVFIISALLFFLTLNACQSVATPSPVILTSTNSISTATYSPTSTPTNTILKIPQWLSDSKNMVVLIEDYGSGTSPLTKNSVTFLNPLTGEKVQFNVNLFEDAVWLDANNVAFKSGKICEFKDAMVLNLVSGEYDKYDEERYQGIDKCVSKTKKYSALINYQSNGDVRIYNRVLDIDEKVIPAPESNHFNWGVEASPDDSIVALAQGKEDWRNLGSDQIIFYSIDSLKITKTYYDSNIGEFHYSQDGNFLIYLKNNTPCKLNLEDFSKTCGIEIPKDYQLFHFGGVGKDSNKIIFIADMLDRASKVCFEDIQTGKSRCDYMNVQNSLCIYDIYIGETKCPMREIKDLFSSLGWVETNDTHDVFVQPVRNQYRVICYLFSPDENFIIFTYGPGHPLGHFFSDMKLGVVSVDGNIFYELDESITSVDVNASWRP